MRARIKFSFILCAVLLPDSIALAKDSTKRSVQFNRDVRPILLDACFACHGPDEGKRREELRLDTKAGLDAERVSGGVIPGQGNDVSNFVRRITSSDPEVRMPPPDSGRELSSQQVEILRRWVEQGAPWQKHWTYIVPERVKPPGDSSTLRDFASRSDVSTLSNTVDRFLSERIQQKELQPSPAADRTTLVRRLSLDLIGLPPTLREVDKFVKDKSPKAYEKVVDRLLASKH